MPIIASAMAHRFDPAAVKSFPKGALLAEFGLGGCQLMCPGRAIDAVAQKGGVSSPCAGDFPNKVCGVRV